MSRIRGEGLFWALAKSGAARLANAWKKSLIVGWIRGFGEVEDAFLKGRLALLEELPTVSDSSLARGKTALMKSRERSLFLSLLASAKERFFALPAARVALLIWLSVLFCTVFAIFGKQPVRFSDQIFLGALTLSSLPLFASRRSLAGIFGGSALTSFFLRGVCHRDSDLLVKKECLKSVATPSLLPLSALLGWGMIRMGVCRLVGIVFGTAFSLFLLAFPEWCMILTLSLFPFLQLFAHPTILLSGLCLLLLLSWGIKAACGRRELSFEIYDLPVLLFCLLLAFGGLVSRGEVADGCIAALLASAYLPARRLLAEAYCRRLARLAMVISASAVALIGILQFFFGDLPVMWVDTNRFSDAPGRVSALFGNPNLLAIYLLLCLPHALFGACNRQRSVPLRSFFALGAVLETICLILTWSRGAWLGLLLEAILFLFFYSSDTRAAALLSPIPLVATLPWLPHRITDRFLSIGELTESSIRYRIYTWQGVKRMLAVYPHGIGVGEEAFLTVYPQYAVSGTERVMHAHSVFLTVAVELGIAGLAVFILLLALPFLRAVARGRISAGILSISGALVMGMFDHLWYERGMLFLLFVFIAWAIVGEEEWEWNPRIIT